MSENTIAGFPSEFDSPEEKKKKSWGLKWAKAAKAQADRKEQQYTNSNQKEVWVNNRKYSAGFYDVPKLQKRAIPTETEWMDLPFNVSTPAQLLIRNTKESIYSHPYKPEVELFDSHSHSRHERKKNELLAKMNLSKEVQGMKAEGIIPEQMSFKQLSKPPKDEHEIEMYLKTNSKVIEQIAIEKLVRKTFANSNMAQLERKLVSDLVDLKWAAAYCGVDEYGQFKIENIDVVNLFSSYVENDDFSDAIYFGHIKWITVGQLRRRMPKLTNDELMNIVRMNAGNRLKEEYNLEFGNRRYFNLNHQESEALEGVQIQILNFEVLQSDKVTYVEKELKTGGYDIKKRSSDYKAPKDGKKQVHSGVVERIYQGEHIMNTDYMLSWGIKPNVIYKLRKGKTIHKPCFSYVVSAPEIIEMQNKSLVEEIIPNIEMMIILQIKLLHFLALATPPGFAYDTTSIVEGIKGMGMKGIKPKDMAAIKSWTGDIYYASRDEMGNPILQSGQKPIEFQPSTVDQAIERFANLWNMELAKIERIIGMNDAVNSATPDKRAAVANQEMAFQAHKSSIRNLQNAYLEMVKDIAYRAAYYQQIAIKNGTETDEMRDLLSDPEFELLKSKELGEIMFNMDIKLMPDAKEKAELKADLNLAVQSSVLGYDDKMVIQRLMEEDSMEKAEEVFLMRVDQRKREAAEAAQAEAEREQQMVQMSVQLEQQKEQAKIQGDLQLVNAETQGELAKIAAKEEADMKSMSLEYELKERLAAKTAELTFMYDQKMNAPKADGRASTPSPERAGESI